VGGRFCGRGRRHAGDLPSAGLIRRAPESGAAGADHGSDVAVTAPVATVPCPGSPRFPNDFGVVLRLEIGTATVLARGRHEVVPVAELVAPSGRKVVDIHDPPYYVSPPVGSGRGCPLRDQRPDHFGTGRWPPQAPGWSRDRPPADFRTALTDRGAPWETATSRRGLNTKECLDH